MLAELLDVQPEVLRYGEAVRQMVQHKKERWERGVGYLERETFDAFLKLPAEQRQIVRQTILLFEQANKVQPERRRRR